MSAKPLPAHHPFRSPEARERYLAHYDARADAWPLQSDVLMVETPEATTCVRVHGPEGAPPLFLLNGAWCNSTMWSPKMVARLAEVHRTYLLDNLHEFGRTVGKSRPTGKAAEYTRWLDGLFDALGLSHDINIFGISRGAWMAAEYVLTTPDRVGKAVWLSPALVVGKPRWSNPMNMLNFAASMAHPTARTVAATMRNLMPEMEKRDQAYFDRFVGEMVIGLQCFGGVLRASIGPRTFTDAELAAIDAPVLCLLGETETLLHSDVAAQRLASIAPQIECVVLPGAGHDLIDAQMDPMLDTVLEFLGPASAASSA